MSQNIGIDPIRLEVFKHQFSALAEEMSVILRKASYSANIKERRDFSCAVFDDSGNLVAQAANIPVHLGSMPLAVSSAIDKYPFMNPGDTVILNDPYQGGTHLPDITLVTPVYYEDDEYASIHVGYVASRAHHADIGGSAPGSMSISQDIFQEGLIIPPTKLVVGGVIQQGILDIILSNVRTPDERLGDIKAQLGCNQRGVLRLISICKRYGSDTVKVFMKHLQDYTELITRQLLSRIPDGVYQFSDVLDDDGLSEDSIPIQVKIIINGDQAIVDFSGSSRQVEGSLNAVYAITLSAVYYVFRSLINLDVPNNAGCLAPIKVLAPKGTVVNASPPAAVAGGNVETSQRIVDTLLGALAKAVPNLVPAASQGSMNNVTIGGIFSETGKPFTYYETIAGGGGARPDGDGLSGRHSHMTNTMNTPAEALEYAYPIRILRYSIRRGSGGAGKYQGGDGVRRDIQILSDVQVHIISERRKFAPYGLMGGQPGLCGENAIIRGDQEIIIPGKGSFQLYEGDIISIRTPGGGGYGTKS